MKQFFTIFFLLFCLLGLVLFCFLFFFSTKGGIGSAGMHHANNTVKFFTLIFFSSKSHPNDVFFSTYSLSVLPETHLSFNSHFMDLHLTCLAATHQKVFFYQPLPRISHTPSLQPLHMSHWLNTPISILKINSSFVCISSLHPLKKRRTCSSAF